MALNHCDGDRFGQPCRTLFAVGLLHCPHCGATDYHEFGSQPGDEEHPMAKITPQGPSNTTAAAEPGEQEEEPRAIVAEAPAAPSVLQRPATNDSKGDWLAYAELAHGLDPEAADGAFTKRQLQDVVGKIEAGELQVADGQVVEPEAPVVDDDLPAGDGDEVADDATEDDDSEPVDAG